MGEDGRMGEKELNWSNSSFLMEMEVSSGVELFLV